MYLRTMKELYQNYNCQYLVLDIKKGSYENIVNSSRIFSLLCSTGLDKFIILKKEDSYEQKLLGGKSEKFERLELYLPIIVRFMNIHSWFSCFTGNSNKPLIMADAPAFVDKNPHFVPVQPDNPIAQMKTMVVRKTLQTLVMSATLILPFYFFSKKY